MFNTTWCMACIIAICIPTSQHNEGSLSIKPIRKYHKSWLPSNGTWLHVYILPLHIKIAGSGFHIPSSPHTEVILPSGRSPDWHWYTICEPTVVLATGSSSTRPVKEGIPQLTEKNVKDSYISIHSLFLTHMCTQDQQGQGSTSHLLCTLFSFSQLEQTLGHNWRISQLPRLCFDMGQWNHF